MPKKSGSTLLSDIDSYLGKTPAAGGDGGSSSSGLLDSVDSFLGKSALEGNSDQASRAEGGYDDAVGPVGPMAVAHASTRPTAVPLAPAHAPAKKPRNILRDGIEVPGVGDYIDNLGANVVNIAQGVSDATGRLGEYADPKKMAVKVLSKPGVQAAAQDIKHGDVGYGLAGLANEALKGTGRTVKDLATLAFSPINVLLAPAAPVIDPVLTTATNLVKGTAIGNSTLAPEIKTPQSIGEWLSALSTPGAVSSGSPEEDAILDELVPLAAFAALGGEGKSKGKVPEVGFEAVKEFVDRMGGQERVDQGTARKPEVSGVGKVNEASQKAGRGTIIKPRAEKTPAEQQFAERGYEKAKAGDQGVGGGPLEAGEALPEVPIVRKAEGPKSAVEQILQDTGIEPPKTDERTPLGVPEPAEKPPVESEVAGVKVTDRRATAERPETQETAAIDPDTLEGIERDREPAPNKDGFTVVDKRRVTPETGAKKARRPIQAGDSIPAELYVSRKAEIDATLKKRGLQVTEGGKVEAIPPAQDPTLATMAEAQNPAEKPKGAENVKGKHVGYATDGKPVFDFEAAENPVETVQTPKAQAAAAGAETAPVVNNASGESPASVEAQNRLAAEQSRGEKWVRIDTRSGKETPVAQTTDAVDLTPGPYDVLEKRNAKGEVVDRKSGDKARPVQPKQAKAAIPPVDEVEALGKRAKAMNMPRFVASLKPTEQAAIRAYNSTPENFWRKSRERTGTPNEVAKPEVQPSAATPPPSEPNLFAERDARLTSVLDSTPDGVTINGWKKQTVDGKVQWVNGGETISSPEVITRAGEENVMQAVSVADRAPVATEGGAAFPSKDRIAGTDGKETRLRIPGNDEPIKARYRLVELDDVQPSHHGMSFAANPEYPIKQDRNYETDKAEQGKVVTNEQKFDPSFTINTDNTVQNGPSVVTPDGRVLGGNSRIMTLQRLYKNGRGDLYKNYLADNAEAFGVTPEQVRGMRNPVIVREMEAPKTIDEASRRINDFNKTTTASTNPVARAISMGKRLSPDSVGKLASMLRDLSDGDKPASIANLLSERPKEVLDILRKEGAITPEEVNGLTEQTDTGLKFTDEAKGIIGDAMLGNVLGDADLVQRMSPRLKDKVQAVLGEMLDLKSRGEDPWNVTNIVKQAVDDHYQASLAGMTMDEYYRQGGLFAAAENPLVESMARLMSQNQKPIKAAFRQFTMDARQDIPGQGLLGLTEKIEPNVAFKDAFGTDLSPEEYNSNLGRAWVERNGAPPEETSMGMALIPPDLASKAGRAITGGRTAPEAAATAKLGEIRKAQSDTGPSFFQKVKDAAPEAPRWMVRKLYDRFVDWRKLVEKLNKNGIQLPAAENPDYMLDIVYGSTGGKLQAEAIRMNRIIDAAEKEGVHGQLQDYLNLKAYERAYQVLHERRAELATREAVLAAERSAGRAEIKQGTKKPVAEARDLVSESNELSEVRAEIKAIDDRIANGRVVPKYGTEAEVRNELSTMRQAMSAAKFAEVQLHADKVFDLNRKALDLAHDEGIVSDAVYNKLVARGNEYIPLERIMDDVRKSEQSRAFTQLDLKSQKIIRSIEGSELVNVNPFTASLNKIFETIREVERNKAGKSAVRTLERMNQIAPNTIFELKNGRSVPHDMGVIAYFEDGKPRRFAAPKLLADALTIADAQERNAVANVVMNFTRQVFRTGATGANVAFIARNIARDQQGAVTLSKAGLTSPVDLARFEKEWGKAFASVVKKDDAYLEFLESGAANSNMQKQISPKTFLRLDKPGPFEVANVPGRTLRTIEEISNAAEEATKMAVYNRLRARGMSEIEAAIETRRYGGSPDFARRGESSKPIDMAMMFFNANLQGLGATLKRKGGVIVNPKTVGAALGATLTLYAWNQQFEAEDGGKEWDHVSTNDKQKYWTILLPETYRTLDGQVRHRSYRVPKGHPAQTLFNPIESIIDNTVSGKHDYTQTALDVVSNMIPGSFNLKKDKIASTGLQGLIASSNPIIREPLEQVGNVNTSTGGAIVPERMKDVTPSEQYRDTTSGTAKFLGKAMEKVVGDSPIVKNLASPLRIEHAVRGTLAGIGDQVLALFDTVQPKRAAENLMEGDEKFSHSPFGVNALAPLLRTAVGTTADQWTRDREEKYFTLAEKARTSRATFNDLMNKDSSGKMATDWVLEDPERLILAAKNGDIANTVQTLSKLRKAQQMFAENEEMDVDGKKVKLTPEQRKQAIAALHKARVEVLKTSDELDKLIEVAGQRITERRKQGKSLLPAKGE
jgi:hypothetical protein